MELLEKLGALGYVGGAAPAQTSTPGADPKDKIAEFRVANALMREGIERLGERDFAASAARFQELLRRGIESFEAHFYLGRALSGLGRHAEAAQRFEEAVRRAPALADGWTSLARARLALGQKQKAREAYEKALAPGAARRRPARGAGRAVAGPGRSGRRHRRGCARRWRSIPRMPRPGIPSA